MKKTIMAISFAFLSNTCMAQNTITTPDIDGYRNLFDNSVTEALPFDDTEQNRLFDLVKKQMALQNFTFSGPQLGLVVDRGINQQKIAIVLFDNNPDSWNIIGETHVSTGKPGRKEHFKTPTGIFIQDGSILGYRAEGTYNENHIRGLGIKGMRVWDFGWQTTEDWRTNENTMKIRMEMHATDPARLAQRIGKPDSEGCIRIPADLNSFLDHYGVIDKTIENLSENSKAFKALLGPQHTPLDFNGDTVIIVDGG